MKSDTLKSALNAHGWVGLLLSLPLFIVFWAGAITLFHPEFEQWAKHPYYQLDLDAKARGEHVNYNEIVEQQLLAYQVLPGERIAIRPPTNKSPYLRIFFRAPVLEEGDSLANYEVGAEATSGKPKIEKEFVDLLIDPHSGAVFTDHDAFELADFLYALHYNLHLPQGLYIVGIITLFFFAIIITGIVVQLKNIVRNFFLYRKDQNRRSQMNDMHNVIGVISLPYAVMYALSGVILNLLIIVQIPSVFLLYKGDLNAITADAGFYTYSQKPAGESLEMPELRAFKENLEAQNNAEITGLNVFNYGDVNAVVQANGLYSDGFNAQFTRFYQVATGSYPEDMNLPEDNAFSVGLLMLYSMHFANFAGTDMRFLYFVLAILFCGMIVAGNVLWVVKRQKKNRHPKTLAFARGATLGGCIGIITATAVSILLERTLPVDIDGREHWIEYTFGAVLLVITIAGFFVNKLRFFIGYNVVVSAIFLIVTIIFEWVVFGDVLIALGEAGYRGIWYFSMALSGIACLLMWIGFKVLKYAPADPRREITATEYAVK